MAEKTETEKTQEQEPDFSNVVFEGEDQVEQPAGRAEGGEAGGAAGDERLGEREGLTAAERAGETQEQKQERRRKERAEKKARVKAEREENRELKTELRRLAGMVEELGGKVDTRIGGIEGRQATSELRTVDNRLAMLRTTYANGDAAYQKAFTEGDGAKASAAQKAMRDAETEYNALVEHRKTLAGVDGAAPRREQPRQERQQEAERPDPRVARLANAFIADFPEYDPDGSDQDSIVVQALDAAVTAEGFDPRTQEYWDELRDRVLDRIPEWDDQPKRNGKAAGANGTRPRARSTVQGSGRDGGGDGSGSATKFVVSKERVQAMKDAGIWEDPKRRAKQIEAFRKWDRENPQQRGS